MTDCRDCRSCWCRQLPHAEGCCLNDAEDIDTWLWARYARPGEVGACPGFEDVQGGLFGAEDCHRGGPK